MKAVREKQKRKGGAEKQTPLEIAVTPAPPRAPTAWRRHALLLLGLALVVFVAYSNSFSAGFVFDNAVLLQDSRIKAPTPENIDLILNQEYWYNWSVSGLYRPLTTFSYLLNYSILGNGDHPAGYHWINLGLHIINIALVYALGLVIFGEITPAFALAAVWSLHPLLTESVTNIVGRADLLSGFGVLAGFLCHVMGASARGIRKSLWLAGLVLATLVGAFSKESSVVIVAVMLIYDLTHPAVSWRDRAPGYAAVSLPLLFFLYVRGDVLGKLPLTHFTFGDNALLGGDFISSRLTAFKVLGKYFWLLIWPQHLSADYSYNAIPLFSGSLGSWEDWKALLSLALCLAFAALAVYSFRRDRRITFFIAFFFIAISPTSNLLFRIGSIMAERFLYLPSIGFAGCLVIAGLALGRRLPAATAPARFAVPAALALLCIACAARTWFRNADWHDAMSLFSSAARTYPASYKAHMSLAVAWNDGTPAGLANAISEIEKSMAILKPLPDELNAEVVYINAGAYYRQKGDRIARVNTENARVASDEAQSWYRKSLDVLLEGQRIEVASNAAIRRDDLAHGRRLSDYSWYQLDMELGRTYLRLGRPRDALLALQHGRKQRQVPPFYMEMAAALQSMGEAHQAAVTLMEGLIVDPTYTKFATGLVELYKEVDPQGCALRTAGSQISLNLECPLVRTDLCSAARNVSGLYLQINQNTKAIQTANTAMHDFGCPAELFR